MPPGGRRPGAGRKKGFQTSQTLDKLQAREHLRQLVIAQMQPMVDAQIGAAKGLNIAVVRRPDGTFRRIDSAEAFDAAVDAGDLMTVTTLQPSTQAFSDLMNRALDKPTEIQEVTHSGGIDIRWKGDG